MARDGTVLLTGASGFVGSAVARRLRAAGFSVRALVRPTSPLAHLSDLDLEFATGDLRDPEAVRRAMAGARFLFHVAADYRLWARDPDELTQTNVAGTRLLMEEAMRAGVERVVYTSSVATLAARADGVSADETMPLTEDRAIGVYKRSKVAAERAVEALIAQGLPAVIVNPSTPIGPRDVKPTPTGRIIVEAASGRMPAFVDTGLNMVHVDDVAEGHFLAFERGRTGERYVLGGQNASLAEILATVAETVGRRPPRIRIPRQALVPFAHVSEAVARRTGREPMLTLDGLRMSKNKMFFSSAKAERELGYRARPYREGITDAIAWFRRAGYLRR
ncbi:MAG TPA: hopanoid-associated sugar epimerase [Pseudolabrys sp.]